MLLALWLERKFTKDQILTLYLNRVYLGAGTYGIEAAAMKYFDKPARELDVYEAAMIAGLLKAPSRYNPLNDPDAAARRTRVVLNAMADAGFIPSADVRTSPAARRTFAAASVRPGRYFVDWVLEQVPDFVAPGERDLVVATTLDPALQRQAETAVAGVLSTDGRRLAVSQGALVALAPDGAVRAMVGGRDYGASQFNRATQAARQPGSAFKPFIYLAGLESGLTPESEITDAPVTIDGWSPANFDGRFRGPVTLTRALAESINSVAVRVGQKAGWKKVVKTAHRLGIASDLTTRPSLALGTSEVSVLELTGAYAPFANGGFGVWTHGISQIRDSAGNVLYSRSGSGPGRVIAPERVAAMNRMMAATLENGSGKAAAFGRPAAGKTGTSQDFRDAWFVGYTANLITAVWMGNDNGASTKGVTGGALPARTWKAFMEKAHENLAPQPLPGLTPDGGGAPGWLEALFTRIGGEG